MNNIKVLIADDQAIIRDGLKLILNMEEDISVVGVAENGNEAFQMISELNPDVVLMDIRMPECDGVMGTKKICETYPNTKIIILTTFNDDKYIFEALKFGAKGYLLKDVKSEELASSIRMVMKGSVLIHPEVAIRIVSNLSSQPVKIQEPSEDLNSLTEREKDILKLIASGKNNKQIAGELFLSEGTVKNHITSILSKLYLRDRTQLALYAKEKGIF
ncbi:response regulator transcription factor [Clostridium sp. 19966]|uniref:response regulator transcription factor n=1 Tax=Clostridium sp. 19966 TaxID=2768166 RepID=UPI0028DF6D8D|nr:response regulator transcription factor [Clostridium sp. 19966]MDT8718904.1 response regulator transcription factor [Clostridium sp. 19966]